MEPYSVIIKSLQPKFDKMWRSACRVCDNILAYQPDLLLVLMHSGWGPVFAAQIIWQQTQSRPFPPVARTNLGREKIDVFESAIFGEISATFVGEYSPDEDIDQFLDWVASRADWQAQLRQQVVNAMQTDCNPKRILVVDDCIHEGSTGIVTLGLLNCVYPEATLRFLNAHSWNHGDYLELMLKVLGSQAEVFSTGKFPPSAIETQLRRIAIGSEDVFTDSLDWQSISVNSPSVQALREYRLPAEWVQISQTIYAIIGDFISERASSYVSNEPDLGDINFSLRGREDFHNTAGASTAAPAAHG